MRLLIDTVKRENPAYPMPWNSTATCFNFNAPTRTVLPNYRPRKPEKIETLVVNCKLPEYEFISQMENLEQLYILDGSNVKSLYFLKGLTKLKQLCLVGTKVDTLEDLSSLIELKQQKYKEESGDSPKEEFGALMKYSFEGLYFESKKYKGDGSELLGDNEITRKDIWINKKCITRY